MTKRFQLLSCILLLCILSVYPTSCECSCTDKNKYYIPPSETPNFSTIEDYQGQRLRRQWDLKCATIILATKVNDEVKLTWRSNIIEVYLKKYADKSIDQKWKFNTCTATITLQIKSDRAIYQLWNLGKKWLRYEKNADGSTKSEGTATSKDLAKYEHEMDLWCQANCRFFPNEDCPIYSRN